MLKVTHVAYCKPLREFDDHVWVVPLEFQNSLSLAPKTNRLIEEETTGQECNDLPYSIGTAQNTSRSRLSRRAAKKQKRTTGYCSLNK